MCIRDRIISSSKESGYNAQYTTSTSSTSVSFLRSLQPSIFSIFSWFLFPALVLFVSTNPRQYSPSGNPFSFKCSGLKLYFSCASFVSFTYEPPFFGSSFPGTIPSHVLFRYDTLPLPLTYAVPKQ